MKKKKSHADTIQSVLGNLIGFAIILCVYGGIVYLVINRHQFPWYWLPVLVAASGFLHVIATALGRDQANTKGGDLTSQFEGIAIAFKIVTSLILALFLVIGHYL